MPSLRDGAATPRLAGACALLMVVVVVGAVLAWYRPFLVRSRAVIAGVPAPGALFNVTDFRVPKGGRACMNSVTVTPQSRLAAFVLRPGEITSQGGPPLEVTLGAPGYTSSATVPGGYPGGGVQLPITPPTRALVATICFANRGSGAVLLAGTDEPRTISRPKVKIDGRWVAGDIALTFYDVGDQSLTARLGALFSHASNLTDGFVPEWGVALIALMTAFLVPAAMIFAFYSSVRDDELDR